MQTEQEMREEEELKRQANLRLDREEELKREACKEIGFSEEHRARFLKARKIMEEVNEV